MNMKNISLQQQLQNAAVASGKKLVDEYKITGDINGYQVTKNGRNVFTTHNHTLISVVQYITKNHVTPGDRIIIDAEWTIE